MISEKELKVVNCMKEVFNQRNLGYDPEKLEYNAKYKSNSFFEKKFPEGYNCSWFYPVIELCCKRANQNNNTPLKEMEKRIKESSEK